MKRIILGIFYFSLPILALASCGGKNNTERVNDSLNIPAEETEQLNNDVLSLEEALEIKGFKVIDNVLFSENVPVVVDFYADWCGPCKVYSPVFHEVAAKYAPNILFVSINVDNYPEISNAYKVQNIPCTVFLGTEGTEIGKEVGILTAEKLESYINQLIDASAGENIDLGL